MTVERAVRVRTSAGERSARMQDLSLTGCFLETSATYEVGAILELSFALSSGDEQPLTTEARVVRRTQQGVGVRFVFSDAQTPLTLKRWLSSHPAA
ncbi:MAG: PilZ domain-containing protein [Nitrospirota bacterium]